jgi:hypothetical protein
MGMFAEISLGKLYSRNRLPDLWGYSSFHGLARGVVTPRDSNGDRDQRRSLSAEARCEMTYNHEVASSGSAPLRATSVNCPC